MEMKKLSEEEVESLPKDIIIKLFMSMQSSVESLEATIKLLSEQIKIMNQRSFGRSTEKQSSGIFEQLELGFNEPEVLFDLLQPEPTLEEAAPRKKAKGKRASDIQKITNHREEYIELSEEELNERFGKSGWKRLPYQIITKLEHIPASFEAVTYKIGVYAAKDNQTIIRAQKPVELWPNSIATPSLVSSIIWGKYVNAVPLYRQEKTYQENQINISRSTMANWMIQASDNYFIHFYDRLKEEMIKQDILHADETPFEVSKDGRKAGSKSYMWVYRTGAHEEEKRIVLYDYRSTRSHEHPQRFLEGFRGTLVCDGYSAYHQLAKEDPESFTVAGCWTHLKRKFTTLIKAVKTSQTLAQAEYAASKAKGKEANFQNLIDSYLHSQLEKQLPLDTLVDLKIQKLIAYDCKYETKYYETLCMYVNSQYSKQKTAEGLYIHLNTVKYRLQQIEKLFDIDFEKDEKLIRLAMLVHHV